MYKQLYQQCEATNNTSNTKFIIPNSQVYFNPPEIYSLDDTKYRKRLPLFDYNEPLNYSRCRTPSCTAAAAAFETTSGSSKGILRDGLGTAYRYWDKAATPNSDVIVESYLPPCCGGNQPGSIPGELYSVSSPTKEQNAINYHNCKNCQGI